MNNRGFTKIELIVVIALIIAMVAVDIALILYLNLKSKDIAVLSDIKQIQSGLDNYLLLNNNYPIEAVAVALNDPYANTEKLCTDGFKKNSESCSQTILAPVPNSFLNQGNTFKYQSTDGQNYKIEFTLNTNFKAANLSKGLNCASNNQILSQPCF